MIAGNISTNKSAGCRIATYVSTNEVRETPRLFEEKNTASGERMYPNSNGTLIVSLDISFSESRKIKTWPKLSNNSTRVDTSNQNPTCRPGRSERSVSQIYANWSVLIGTRSLGRRRNGINRESPQCYSYSGISDVLLCFAHRHGVYMAVIGLSKPKTTHAHFTLMGGYMIMYAFYLAEQRPFFKVKILVMSIWSFPANINILTVCCKTN